MRTIIHNPDNLSNDDINRVVKRSKAVIVNDKDEILIGTTNDSMWLPGGHVDEGESYDECLLRELKEETGVLLKDIDKMALKLCIFTKIKY